MKIDHKDVEIANLRGRLDQQKWVNRQQRQDSFYGRWSGPAYPVVMYADPYHSMFNYWLLSQTIDVMALMIIHHQATMDQARIADLYRRNAQLEAKVAAMRASGVKPDPTWTPPGADADLCYNDEYVNATYNPRPKETVEYHYSEGGDSPSGSSCSAGCFFRSLGRFIGWCLVVVLVGSAIYIFCRVLFWLFVQYRF